MYEQSCLARKQSLHEGSISLSNVLPQSPLHVYPCAHSTGLSSTSCSAKPLVMQLSQTTRPACQSRPCRPQRVSCKAFKGTFPALMCHGVHAREPDARIKMHTAVIWSVETGIQSPQRCALRLLQVETIHSAIPYHPDILMWCCMPNCHQHGVTGVL